MAKQNRNIIVSIIFSLFITTISLLTTPQIAISEQVERVIITFKSEINEQLLKDPAIEVHHEFPKYNAVAVSIPKSTKQRLLINETIQQIEIDPPIMKNNDIINWGLKTVLTPTADDYDYTGKGVKVGVIDSGIATNHPRLKVAGGISFIGLPEHYDDEDGHGTHVAGIIGATKDKANPIGVAPDVALYAIKIIDEHGFGNHSDVAKGIEWSVAKGLDIVNLSITTTQKSMIMERSLADGYKSGLLIVGAAGNSKQPLYFSDDVLYPARFPSVIAVGSINKARQRSLFSYFGSSLEFVAPGENIISTYINTNSQLPFASGSGTSMATPFVTGIAALYKEAYPLLSNVGIRSLMQKNALDLGKQGKDPEFGYGLIQAPEQQQRKSFPDLVEGSWYYEQAKYLIDQNIMKGFPDGTFRPAAKITRAEAITMIGRALHFASNSERPPYYDVPEDHYASRYIVEGTNRGIINGYPGNLFGPSHLITRGQSAVMLSRAFNFKTTETTRFSDVKKDKYFADAIHTLKGANITTGFSDNTFRPDNDISRAEFATLLARILQKDY